MKIGAHEFTPRSGVTGYCLPYDPATCKQMSGGKVRLTPTANASAGLMGPSLGYGTYEFEFTGRGDDIDPRAVVAIWTYDEASKDEIDFFEFARWGDANQPNNLQIGIFDNEVRQTGDVKVPSRAYRRWRMIADVQPGVVRVRMLGFWDLNPEYKENEATEPGWKTVALWTGTLRPDFVVGQLRLAYWVSPKGFMYPAANRGEYVTFERFTFAPFNGTR